MMWSTFWTLAVIAAAVVGMIIVGKDNEFWDEDDDDKPNT